MKVPDIGDFADVPVIEVLVAAGDEVAVEDPLITLESDKATMDVPAPAGGRDQRAEGQGRRQGVGGLLILLLEAGDGAAPSESLRQRPHRPRRSAGRRRRRGQRRPRPQPPVAPAREADVRVQVAVLGAGPGRLHGRVPGRRPRAEVALIDRGERSAASA